MAPLRIGVVAPPWFAVPPAGYGGVERVVSYLTEGLVRRGHRVTLFASGGSHTTANLSVIHAEPPSPLLGDAVVEARHVAAAYRRANEFDVIHDHTMLGLVAGSAISGRVVHTIHGAITPQAAEFYQEIAGSVRLVCISEHQRSTLPAGLERPPVIYNAVAPEEFPFRAEHGGYLLWVGRICPEKGILEAIEIARRARRPLRIVAKVNEIHEREYFAEQVRPALAGLDVDLCEQPPELVRLQAFRDALVTLFPINWPEPFGMVMIESMATGTPVIAFGRGSVPEVIEHGRTGFVVNSIDEAVDAIDRVSSLRREDCRAHVERRFNAEQAVERYERLFVEMLRGDGIRSPRAGSRHIIPLAAGTRPLSLPPGPKESRPA